MNQENRTRTGIQGLDRNLEGGFPRGSMIVVAGNPGTGKTMLCGAFLHHGALQGENGLYVSFSEGRETFISNMRRFGLDFESTRSNRVEILDFITSKEPGVDAIMEMITERIEVNRAERLVIDSFTAMAHAFPSLIDERVVLHILSKIVRTTGCTTILVTEVPTGRQTIGTGIEEFIVDGIIIARRRMLDGSVLRELETIKMRGTITEHPRQVFSLHRGFTVFEPFSVPNIDEPRPYIGQLEEHGRYSTGSPDLNAITGGYGHGDTVYVETGRNTAQGAPRLLLGPLLANSLTNGMGVLLIPTCGQDADCVINWISEYGVDSEASSRLMKVAEIGNHQAEGGTGFPLDPDDVKLSHRMWNEKKRRLVEETGRPVLKLINIDMLGVHWPLEPTRRLLETEAKLTRSEGGLLVLVSGPGEGALHGDISNMSNVHIRLDMQGGVVLLHGIRPRTPLHAVESTGEKGYPTLKLTQIS